MPSTLNEQLSSSLDAFMTLIVRAYMQCTHAYAQYAMLDAEHRTGAAPTWVTVAGARYVRLSACSSRHSRSSWTCTTSARQSGTIDVSCASKW